MAKASSFPRHFVHKHSLFSGRETVAGTKWNESVYYYWWEFLRRHNGYKAICERGGHGKYAKLYEDFGDVYADDFKTWWYDDDRGARLFAEPQVPLSVRKISIDEIKEIGDEVDTSGLLLIAVPLHLPKRFIETKIRAVLKANHKRRRGERLNSQSAAKYPVTHQFSINSLKTILAVHDLRINEPNLALWEIAQRLKFTTTLDNNELKLKNTSGHTNKKQVMASTVSRMVKKADKIINGVGLGRFPEIN